MVHLILLKILGLNKLKSTIIRLIKSLNLIVNLLRELSYILFIVLYLLL